MNYIIYAPRTTSSCSPFLLYGAYTASIQEITMTSQIDTTLSGIRTYTLTLYGEVDADFASSFCPPETKFARDGKTFTLANLRLDQSGLIGLLRQLHNFGCVILSLQSEQEIL